MTFQCPRKGKYLKITTTDFQSYENSGNLRYCESQANLEIGELNAVFSA